MNEIVYFAFLGLAQSPEKAKHAETKRCDTIHHGISRELAAGDLVLFFDVALVIHNGCFCGNHRSCSVSSRDDGCFLLGCDQLCERTHPVQGLASGSPQDTPRLYKNLQDGTSCGIIACTGNFKNLPGYT